ncbi:MFS transporter [Solicola gregarius]|uniref:Sugar porter family MFS transporter n=1 Tax=Solicola gregarius TaxID=2908642 RepID=A0AA46TK47_9ACTN|nr:MFS transporter [Solicola gregarius]UYM06347.1 sugar porter family MFS transporter [Solicola gregarius]
MISGYALLEWGRCALARYSPAPPSQPSSVCGFDATSQNRPWLARQGHQTEARRISDTYLGATSFDQGALGAENRAIDSNWSSLFRGQQRQRAVFEAVMYLFLVISYFAIFTFAPTVLSTMGVSNVVAGTIALNAIAQSAPSQADYAWTRSDVDASSSARSRRASPHSSPSRPSAAIPLRS